MSANTNMQATINTMKQQMVVMDVVPQVQPPHQPNYNSNHKHYLEAEEIMEAMVSNYGNCGGRNGRGHGNRHQHNVNTAGHQ
eukprot:14810577-Ditylum_brightwellii.AAC.1